MMKLERLAREQERECGFMYKKLGLSKACGAQEMSQTLQDEQEKKRRIFDGKGGLLTWLDWHGRSGLGAARMKAHGHPLLGLEAWLE